MQQTRDTFNTEQTAYLLKETGRQYIKRGEEMLNEVSEQEKNEEEYGN